MREVRYVIMLRSPLVGAWQNRGSAVGSGGMLVPAASIRGAMRHRLRDFSGDGSFAGAHEVRLFGDTSTPSFFELSDAVMSRGDVQVQSFISLSDQRSAITGALRIESVVKSVAFFAGSLLLKHERPSAEGLAILMALMGVDSVGARQSQGFATCTICADISDIETSEFYNASKHASGLVFVLQNAATWIPLIRRRMLEYFAHRPDDLYSTSPRGFERVVAEAFHVDGFDVQLTPETRDGGFDILAVRHPVHTLGEVVLVECKRYRDGRKVGVAVVRSLLGVVQIENATRGVVVTTGTFTRAASESADRVGMKLTLCDFQMLTAWIKGICSVPSW